MSKPSAQSQIQPIHKGKEGSPKYNKNVQAKAFPYSPPDPRLVLLDHALF